MFYQSCLFHAKGVAKYVGNWDIDEFWLPPQKYPDDFGDVSIMSLLHASFNVNDVKVPRDDLEGDDMNEQQLKRTNIGMGGGINPLLKHDKIWQNSIYKNTMTIVDSMRLVEAYQQQNGCTNTEDWCGSHGYPSYTVHRPRLANGTRFIFPKSGHKPNDFERRELFSTIEQFQIKSVAKTEAVHAAGFHEFGSCRRWSSSPTSNAKRALATDYANPHDQQHRDKSYEDVFSGKDGKLCRYLRTNGFGNIHHFLDMIQTRSKPVVAN